MDILFVKLSDQRHRLAVVRDDGSRESHELETRSLLLHDLVHYAVECEAPLDDGFWGLVASGTPIASLSDPSVSTMAAPLSPGLALAEQLVGPMQSLWHARMSVAAYLALASAVAPAIVDEAFVTRTLARLRGLWGHWRATPYGAVMQLRWPATP